jgi:hypothetical protein
VWGWARSQSDGRVLPYAPSADLFRRPIRSRADGERALSGRDRTGNRDGPRPPQWESLALTDGPPRGHPYAASGRSTDRHGGTGQRSAQPERSQLDPGLAFRADSAVLAIGSDGLRLWDVATAAPSANRCSTRATSGAGLRPEGQDPRERRSGLRPRVGTVSAASHQHHTGCPVRQFRGRTAPRFQRIADLSLGGDVPEADRVVVAPGGEGASVGAEDHGRDTAAVAPQWGPRTRRGRRRCGVPRDGRTLISWAQDGTAQRWNVEVTVDPVRSLCGWAGGAFTTDRWREAVPPGPESRPLCPK